MRYFTNSPQSIFSNSNRGSVSSPRSHLSSSKHLLYQHSFIEFPRWRSRTRTSKIFLKQQEKHKCAVENLFVWSVFLLKCSSDVHLPLDSFKNCTGNITIAGIIIYRLFLTTAGKAQVQKITLRMALLGVYFWIFMLGWQESQHFIVLFAVLIVTLVH